MPEVDHATSIVRSINIDIVDKMFNIEPVFCIGGDHEFKELLSCYIQNLMFVVVFMT